MLLLLSPSPTHEDLGTIGGRQKSPQPQSRIQESNSPRIQKIPTDPATSLPLVPIAPITSKSDPATSREQSVTPKPTIKRSNSVAVILDLAERYTLASEEMMKLLDERYHQENDDPEARLYLDKFRRKRTAQSGLPRKFSFRVLNEEGDKEPAPAPAPASEPECISPEGNSSRKFNYRGEKRTEV